ncbi:Uncharacterised protein [Stenotrophomonas maltophilia]|nr:Uncharacterised protein [Stenotrophomonas maltophilia]
MHLAYRSLQRDHRLGVHHLRYRVGGAAGGLFQDLPFLVFAGVIHQNVQQKTIQLCFRQRVGAGLLDRVLRGQHEERRGQCVGGAGVADRAFLHGFQ